MIRRIRVMSSTLQDDLLDESPAIQDDCAEAEDTGLDLLVRHAIRQEAVSHDGGHVWQKLSSRVKGPFGSLAIEEPAMCGSSMPFFAESSEEAVRQPDSMRHSLFRTAEATFSLR